LRIDDPEALGNDVIGILRAEREFVHTQADFGDLAVVDEQDGVGELGGCQWGRRAAAAGRIKKRQNQSDSETDDA
jgi:hypothetical protein